MSPSEAVGLTPEQKARTEIDRLPIAAGRDVCDLKRAPNQLRKTARCDVVRGSSAGRDLLDWPASFAAMERPLPFLPRIDLSACSVLARCS